MLSSPHLLPISRENFSVVRTPPERPPGDHPPRCNLDLSASTPYSRPRHKRPFFFFFFFFPLVLRHHTLSSAAKLSLPSLHLRHVLRSRPDLISPSPIERNYQVYHQTTTSEMFLLTGHFQHVARAPSHITGVKTCPYSISVPYNRRATAAAAEACYLCPGYKEHSCSLPWHGRQH
ncbi:hypothetical protein IWX49DRAFT_30669 [Phyllosticta citricarpa]|uniref:Uncharacterized protein n=1 Tax=Phyllosticta citricarpa TaxID=55181 RepID=A0ABR1MK86_9PEZI